MGDSHTAPSPELHQAMSTGLSLIRHELRTPINGILGYSEIILEDLEDIDQPDTQAPIQNVLRSIRNHGQDILSSISTNLNIAIETESNFPKTIRQSINTVHQEIIPLLDLILAHCTALKTETQFTDILADIDKIEGSTRNLNRIIHHIYQAPINSVEDILNLFSESQDENSKPDQEIVQVNDIPDQVRDDPATDPQAPALGFILIVDDVENNRILFSRQLQRQGYQIDTAVNGYDALQKIADNAYDLVLLDLMMPDINGYEVLSILKADDTMQHIPVIMISANDEIEQVIRCIEIGAEDYLPKPLNSTLLKARITSTLDKKRLRDREREYLHQVELLSAKMTKELDMGRQMQLNFLPRQLVQHPNWEFSAFFKPARQVAGDFYDTFAVMEHRVAIVIADVCDKGVGAALFMALFRSLIRIFTAQIQMQYSSDAAVQPHSQRSPNNLNFPRELPIEAEQLLEAVTLTNNYVATHHGELSMFATLFLGILEPDTGKLTYINGGHEPLAIVAADGQIRAQLKSTGPAVGMLPDMNFNIAQTNLEPGDILIGYTDGVTEARDISGNFFSKDKLLHLMQEPGNSGSNLLEKVKSSVINHIGAADQFDDITMITVYRRS